MAKEGKGVLHPTKILQPFPGPEPKEEVLWSEESMGFLFYLYSGIKLGTYTGAQC